jgi:hypothetical protein
MKTKKAKSFAVTAQADVPHGRNGKHKQIVVKILDELDALKKGDALKIKLTGLGDSKENIRSALNRASKKLDRTVATAADADFLYVWSNTN